jgi:hypothetical protein
VDAWRRRGVLGVGGGGGLVLPSALPESLYEQESCGAMDPSIRPRAVVPPECDLPPAPVLHASADIHWKVHL